MDQDFGRLILVEDGGPEREFALGKTSILLGRALSNDIVLADVRASREHARLECGPAGCEVVDLGSANGTRVNGFAVQRSQLKPGDVLNVGNSRLRYELAALAVDGDGWEMTRLETPADVAMSLEHEILPMSINETNTVRLVVFSGESTHEVSLEGIDAVSIGRTDENDVAVDQDNVSRRHAEVVRQGTSWVLRDLGSTNGTWHRDERVDERVLEDGDVFRVGRTQIMFKGGYTGDGLSWADETFARTSTRRPVVFVPGMMGSDLWLGNERVWPSVKIMLANPELFAYPAAKLEPRGIVDELVIVPNLIKQDQYNRLGDYLVEELGYRRGVDFFEFPYDWRQDIRLSARSLARTIDSLPTTEPVTVIAHSLGTLVSRYYVERLEGHKRVDRLMLMGGPHLGTVKALVSLLRAPNVLPFGFMGERLRRVIMTFPSAYPILPAFPSGVDQHGNKINFFTDESWLAPEQVPLLRDGRAFRRELGLESRVPTLSILGYGIKTPARVVVKRDRDGVMSEINYTVEPNGDSGVSERSAFLPGSEIHPVQQYHGSLFVDKDVKMRLKIELARQLGR